MFLDHWSLICSRHKEETLTFLTVKTATVRPRSNIDATRTARDPRAVRVVGKRERARGFTA